jgi:hypothetical protein
MGDVDVHGWFDSGELQGCPACGETACIRLPASGSLLCLSCGSVVSATEASARETGKPEAAAE